MKAPAIQLSLDNRSGRRALTELSRLKTKTTKVILGLLQFPGELFRVEALPARAGEMRRALQPSERLLKLLSAFRAFERELQGIKRGGHPAKQTKAASKDKRKGTKS